jgi:O-antigen/teichoic acid export membrane protein
VAEADAPPAAEFNRPVLFRGLSWSAIGYPLNAGSLFLGHVLAARLLTQDDFGAFSLASSIIATVALVAQLGLPHSLLRRAAAALARGKRPEAAQEITSALAVAAGAAAVCGLLVASSAGQKALAWAFPRSAVATVAALVGLRAGLQVLENVVPEVYRAFRDFFRTVLFNGLLSNALMAVALAGLALAARRLSLAQAMALAAVTSTAALLPALAALTAKLGGTGSGEDWRAPRRNPVELDMWLSSIGRILVSQLDMLVVGRLATSRDVALYAVPFRLALLVGLPLMVVNQVVPPLIAGWFAVGERRRLERSMRSTAGLAVLGALVLGVACIALGHPLIRIAYGAQYADAWPVLAILAIGQIAQTWTGSCGAALMMTGHQRVYAMVLVASILFRLLLQTTGYRWAGLEGVAVATAISVAAQATVQLLMVKRLAGFSTRADLPAALERVTARLRAWR